MSNNTVPSEETNRARILDLYRHIGDRVSELTTIHAERLHCGRGCCDCCIDDVTVSDIEAINIRSSYPDMLATTAPHPVGACAFLDNKGQCRIYDARPYVCRTQGLPLHWIVELDDETFAAMRDICPINDHGTPVEQLAENDCWIIGPIEEELSRLQFETPGGRMERVKLREIFNHT